MTLAPIVLFTYNRPAHTRKTIEALKKNTLARESELIIYSDAPKRRSDVEKVKEVRQYLHTTEGFKSISIVEQETNKGLADSIVDGVSAVIDLHKKAIVLEDDIETSVGFLEYMNKALDMYENDERIWHINAYLPYTSKLMPIPETFFLHFMNCWGWGTWKRAWDKAIWNSHELYKKIQYPKIYSTFSLGGVLDFKEQLEANINGEKNTWAINWYTSIVLNNGLCLFPKRSLAHNTGFDGSGQNCMDNEPITNFNPSSGLDVRKQKIKFSKRGYHYLRRYYRYGSESGLGKIYQYYYVRLKITIRKWIKRHT